MGLAQRQGIGSRGTISKRCDDQTLLCLPIGRCQARRAPILAHGTAKHV